MRTIKINEPITYSYQEPVGMNRELVYEREVVLQAHDWFMTQADSYLDYARLIEKDERKRNLIRGKIVHTADVVSAMASIYPERGIEDLTLTEALVTAIFHDVGRFPQLIATGSFDDSSGFDHGSLGCQMILDQYGLFPDVNNIGRIGWAIHLHNKRFTGVGGKFDLARLIRDADKLAVLRHPEVFVRELFGEQSTVNEIFVQNEAGRDISPKVLDDFLAGQSISYDDAKTPTDKLLIKLAWIFDLNFDTTRRVFLEERIPDELFGLIERVNDGRQQMEIGQIRDKLAEWRTDYAGET